jgi:flagellar motor switch protein FliM
MLDNLAETWKPVTEVQFKIQGRETRPQMLQVTGPNEIVILLVFDIRIGETRGMLNLCIPASAIEAVGDSFAQGWHRTRRQPTPDEESWLHANLGRVQVPLTAKLDTTLSARELLALNPGDVIALGHSAENPVDLFIGQIRRFQGHLARKGDGVGLRIERTSSDVHEAQEVVQ